MHIALPHTRTHAKPIYMLLDHRYTTRMPLLYNANAYGNATGCRDVGWWADGGRLMGCRHVSRPVRYASVTSTSFTFSRPIDDTLRHFMQAISSRTAKPGDCIHFEGLRTRRPAATPHVIIGVRSSDEYIYIYSTRTPHSQCKRNMGATFVHHQNEHEHTQYTLIDTKTINTQRRTHVCGMRVRTRTPTHQISWRKSRAARSVDRSVTTYVRMSDDLGLDHIFSRAQFCVEWRRWSEWEASTFLDDNNSGGKGGGVWRRSEETATQRAEFITTAGSSTYRRAGQLETRDLMSYLVCIFLLQHDGR